MLVKPAMQEQKTFWDFATSAAFQWIALTIGLIGTVFGVIAWLDGRKKDRAYKYLLDAAEKNIDKNLTDEQIRANQSEVARTADQIEQLRKRIETEIPIEAKRTVLKDRIDASILTLQATLASTLDLKNQLAALGVSPDLPLELTKAVEAEILPEYVNNARRETLKTYLIIVMGILTLISAVLPGELMLVIKLPLLVIGISILSRLFKEYASKITQVADRSTVNMIIGATSAGALTAAAFAYGLERDRLPNHRFDRIHSQEAIALFTMTAAIVLFGACVWLLKKKGGWAWRLLSAIVAIAGIAAAGLSALMLNNEEEVGELAAAYIFALLAVGMLSAAFYVQVRLKQPLTKN
jgi:hypothetical protein